MPRSPYASPRSGYVSAGPSPRTRKNHAPNWADFEVLVPHPSCSTNGKKLDLVLSTTPFVNSVLRTEAYERLANKSSQMGVVDALSMPKHCSSLPESFSPRHPLHRPAPPKQAEMAKSGLGFAPPPLPPIVRRPTAKKPVPKWRAGEGEDRVPHTDRYSETPFYRRTKQGKVFDLSQMVARERAVVTAGRAFSWGQGHRMGFAPFNPHRERILAFGE